MITQLTPIQLQQHLQNNEDLFLLDVREPFEFEYAKISGSALIPMNQIQQRLHELQVDREMIVICHHGVRSQMVAEFLEYSGFSRIYNLAGGIDAWSQEVDSSVPRY